MNPQPLAITLLIPGPGAWSAKLLGFTPPVICNQQCPVIQHQRLLQLVLSILINVFLIIGYDRLRNSLADGVDLGCMASTSNAYADVHVREFVETDYQERFVDL